MGSAVVRTVVDPETGESIEIMAFPNHGKVRYQRLASVEERINTPRAYENLAAFGETATRAFGRKKTGFLPPAAETVQRERPRISLTSPDRDRDAKQRHYAELLGDAIPEMEEELILRQALRSPALLALEEANRDVLPELEQNLRTRLSSVRAIYLR